MTVIRNKVLPCWQSNDSNFPTQLQGDTAGLGPGLGWLRFCEFLRPVAATVATYCPSHVVLEGVRKLAMFWPMEIKYRTWLYNASPIQKCNFHQNPMSSIFYTKSGQNRKFHSVKLDDIGFGWKPHFWNQETSHNNARYLVSIGQNIANLWTPSSTPCGTTPSMVNNGLK